MFPKREKMFSSFFKGIELIDLYPRIPLSEKPMILPDNSLFLDFKAICTDWKTIEKDIEKSLNDYENDIRKE